MDRRVFFALVYFAALVVVLWLVLKLLSPFLTPIAWAAVLAMAAHPVHKRLLGYLRQRKGLAAAITTLAVLLIVVIPIIFVAILFIGQAANVVELLQKAAGTGQIPGLADFLSNPTVLGLMEKIKPLLAGADLKPLALSTLQGASSVAVGISKSLLLNTLGFVVKFFVMIAVLFFFLKDGEALVTRFWELVPLKVADKNILSLTVDRVVLAVLYGIVLTCVVQGILGGIGFAIAGIPSALFFGAIMVVCAFIPLVGTALLWAPAAIYLMATGHMGRGIFLVAWGVLVISSIDNFIRPFFISGKAKIPMLVILLGVLGGLATMGFLGVIVGPLLFSVSLELARVYKTDLFSQLKTDLERTLPAE